MNTRNENGWSGQCHCGALRLRFYSAVPAAQFAPRACDCSFCRMHGAAYVSDPAGRLQIEAVGADRLQRYRQGSEAAEFLLCGECGVLLAVLYCEPTHCYGAVNVGCLAEPTGFSGAVPSSPQQLDPAAKIARWKQLWIADVQLLTGAAAAV